MSKGRKKNRRQLLGYRLIGLLFIVIGLAGIFFIWQLSFNSPSPVNSPQSREQALEIFPPQDYQPWNPSNRLPALTYPPQLTLVDHYPRLAASENYYPLIAAIAANLYPVAEPQALKAYLPDQGQADIYAPLLSGAADLIVTATLPDDTITAQAVAAEILPHFTPVARVGSEPLITDVYAITADTPDIYEQAVIDWLLSPQGQELIIALGYLGR